MTTQNTIKNVASIYEDNYDLKENSLLLVAATNGFINTDADIAIKWLLTNKKDIMTFLKETALKRNNSSGLEMLHNDALSLGRLTYPMNIDRIADIMLTEQFYFGGGDRALEIVAIAAANIVYYELKHHFQFHAA